MDEFGESIETPRVWTFNKSTEEWNMWNLLHDDVIQKTVTIFQIDPTETIEIKKSEICMVDPTHLLDLDDLCNMNNLHEAPLISILRKRWLESKIYTEAGQFCIHFKLDHRLMCMLNRRCFDIN